MLHKAYETGGITIDYFHLISGQDYPVHSNKVFDMFFEQNEGKSYMQFDSPEFRLSKLHSDYANRTKPWWFLDMPHRDLKIVEFLRKSLNYIGRRTHFRKDVPNLWGGWSWFTWHRNIANYVLRQEKDNPSYFRRFHHTRCGDELIFATLLHPVSQKMNLETNNSLRYVNWNKKIPSRQTRPSAPLTLSK